VRTEHPIAGIALLVTLALLLRVLLRPFVVVLLRATRTLLLVPLVWGLILLFHHGVEPRELAAGVGGEPDPLPRRAHLNLHEVLSDAHVTPREQRHFHLRRLRFRGLPTVVVVGANSQPLVDLQAPHAVPLHEPFEGLDPIQLAAGEAVMVAVQQLEAGAVNRRREEKQEKGEREENRKLKHVVGVPLHYPPHQLCNVIY